MGRTDGYGTYWDFYGGSYHFVTGTNPQAHPQQVAGRSLGIIRPSILESYSIYENALRFI